MNMKIEVEIYNKLNGKAFSLIETLSFEKKDNWTLEDIQKHCHNREKSWQEVYKLII
jgi:hypothetical protein